ncbi:hypothetical protein ODV24_07400 [Lactobacillus amylovorus]|nr:hypothetical protein [Lactobacillus amylovorus]MDB6241706.1 hypothetical protein [Lactobacillus amylovorus]
MQNRWLMKNPQLSLIIQVMPKMVHLKEKVRIINHWCERLRCNQD